MPSSRPKAPPGTYWRADTLWGRARVKGRLIRWSLETDSPKLAAERRKAGKDRVIALGRGDAKLSFADVAEEWSHWISKQVGLATAARYACSLEQIAPFLEGKDLLEIDGPLVAQIVAARSRTVENATVKRDLGALSSVINYAIDQGYREDNPVLPRLGRIRERRDPIVLPDQKHIEIAVSRAPGMVGSLIMAAAVTGARQGELLRAQPNHIDIERRQMTLIGKGNKLRVIDLDPYDAFTFLTVMRPASAAKDRPLFWHDDGQPYASGSFKGNFVKFMKATEKWAKENGVDFRPFRFHDLRHWHAVHFLKDGHGSIYDLQQRLGHTTVTVTEGYLKYLTPEEQKQAKSGITNSITKASVSCDTDIKEVADTSV